MDLKDVILSDKERLEIDEILRRMQRNEPGLYVRQVGPLVLVHTRGTKTLQRERITARIKKKELKIVRYVAGGRIAIFKEIPRERR